MPPMFSWEIINLIAQQIYLNEALDNLLSFCLVSHDFFDASISWLYRHIILSPDKPREWQLIINQIGSDKAKYVHEIYISPGALAGGNERFSTLGSLIPKLPALRRFIPISNGFLEQLSQAQNVRDIELFYDIPENFLDELPPPALSGNPKLTALYLQIHERYTSPGGNHRLRRCQTMILEAPALKSLNLTWAEPYVFDDEPNSTRNITFRENQMLPAVESLVLTNCLIGPDQARSGSPLQLFKIKTLRLRQISLESLNPFLTDLLLERQKLRLKEFEIESPSLGLLSVDIWQKTLSEFLHAFTGLEELILNQTCGLSSSLVSGIAGHGETLKTLKIHNPEMRPDRCVTAEEIKDVCDMCPNLQELTLDLLRGVHSNSVHSNGFDDSILNTLQAFPRLRKLEISTPLTIGMRLNPVVDASFVKSAAIRLRGHRLKEVLIHVGGRTIYLEMWHLPSDSERGSLPKSSWWIEYVDNGQGFRARDFLFFRSFFQDTYNIELMQLMDYLGLPHEPPEEWSAFKDWHDRLLSQIEPRATRERMERLTATMMVEWTAGGE